MAEELSDYPAAFADDERVPWEIPQDGVRWPFGSDKGRLLAELSSAELLRKRRWLEELVGLLRAIDDVLTERGGE